MVEFVQNSSVTFGKNIKFSYI